MREITFQTALEEAVAEEMRRDPRVLTMATDFTGNPIAEFGPTRVRFSPISESVLTGMGLGAAGCGFRPIVHWRMVTFSFVAMDQIVNQVSKIRYMFGGQADFPVTYRCTTGGGIGLAAQHSQSPYSMWMHLAGLKVVLPSTPADAKGLLKSAIRDNNPVVSFECSRLAGLTGPVPDGDHLVPIGVADVKRAGTDVTIVALAYYVHEALALAEELAREGIGIEVVDPRTLVPLDVDTLHASVRKTGRVVIVDEAPATCSAASEIAALIAEDPETFRALKAPIRRVCAVPVPVPYSPTRAEHGRAGAWTARDRGPRRGWRGRARWRRGPACPSRRRSSTARWVRTCAPRSSAGGLLAFARVAQHLRHPLQQLPADHPVCLHERAEIPVGEPVTGELARGGDRGRARALVEQGDLAEVVAGLQRSAPLAADRHRGLTRLDHKEGGPARAFLDDRLTFGEAARLEQARDLLHLALGQVGEEGHTPKDFDGGASHRDRSYRQPPACVIARH
jgi:pyruvate dehydrogenase E1 component beta subunit